MNKKNPKISTGKNLIDLLQDLEKTVFDRKRYLENLEDEKSQSEISLDEQIKKYKSSNNNNIDKEIAIKEIRQNQKRLMEVFNKRKDQILKDFSVNWLKTLKKLDDLCISIRNRQPHLDKITDANINISRVFPDFLAFGRIKISYQDWHGFMPRLVRFPFGKPLWSSTDSKNFQIFVNQLLLRMLTALPQNSLRIIACDAIHLGSSIKPFLPLKDNEFPFIDRQILTNSSDIEAVLQREKENVENILQFKFKDCYSNWLDYNNNDRNNPLPYRLVLLFGIPEQLTEKSIWALGRLLEYGPKCGVLPVLTVNASLMEERKYETLNNLIKNNARRMDEIFENINPFKDFKFLTVSEEHEFWPDGHKLSEIVQKISSNYKNCGKINKTFKDLLIKDTFWKSQSDKVIEIPIGWNRDGEEVLFAIGGVNTEHHALLAGRSGSGKSNLLHVLIHSLTHKYSPAEVKIYLLDYKQGTEFNVYADPPLPHADLVAIESDPEYGVTVLKHLSNELDRRASLFKSIKPNIVKDFYEYRELSSEVNLPRIILIIDEFQILFSESKHVAEDSEKLLVKLFRQGRSYGIHVLLATQTLSGIATQSTKQLISQIGIKICLSCSEEDSATILGGTNFEGATLKSPPEAILNANNGSKSANRKFIVPLAEKIACRDHADTMQKLKEKLQISSHTKIFNGTHSPIICDRSVFEEKLSALSPPALLLGQQLDFQGNLFTFQFKNKASGNLLIAGHDPLIHKYILNSTILSLLSNKLTARIIFYNPLASGKEDIFINWAFKNDNRLTLKYNNWDGNFNEEFTATTESEYKFLIVNGIDNARLFHTATAGIIPQKSASDPNLKASEIFKRLCGDGYRNNTFVIAIVENWKRTLSLCRDYIPLFDNRIGFCLNEDDAGAVAGTTSKLRGLENPNKAFLADVSLPGNPLWFKPFKEVDVNNEERK